MKILSDNSIENDETIWFELRITNGFAVATCLFSIGFIVQTLIILVLNH